MRKRTKQIYCKEKTMDYTGKANVGKRYLDENGNFMPVTSLPKEVQEEIAANSREASRQLMENRMNRSNNKSSAPSNDMSEKLLSIIEAQTEMINRLEDRLEDVGIPAVEPEVHLTPKEALLAEAMDLGLKVNEKMTMKMIQEKINEATQEIVPADSDLYPDTDDL